MCVCEEVGWGQGPRRGVGGTTAAPLAKAVLDDLSNQQYWGPGMERAAEIKKRPALVLRRPKGCWGYPRRTEGGWAAQTKLETRVCLRRKRQWLSV